MKNSLPRFTTAILWWVGVVAVCGIGWKYWHDRRAARQEEEATDNPLLQLARPFLGGAPADDERHTRPVADAPAPMTLLPDSSRSAASAQDLLPQAARRLANYRSLSARIRQRVDLFDQPLGGSGVYQQWGRGQEPRRVRLELKLQVGGQTASLLQIGDGRFLWDRREILDYTSLNRIDLRKVRQTIDQDPALAAPEILQNWMSLGGLAQLLYGLDAAFEFTTAEPAQIGAVPAWVLIGTWKPEVLERHLAAPGPGDPLSRLPPHWPERVQVVLGADEAIPLFPYRIEYQRRRGGIPTAEQGREASEGKFHPVAILELIEVQPGAELDPETFRYDPGNQEVVDETQAFLKRLRDQAPTERPAPSVD